MHMHTHFKTYFQVYTLYFTKMGALSSLAEFMIIPLSSDPCMPLFGKLGTDPMLAWMRYTLCPS